MFERPTNKFGLFLCPFLSLIFYGNLYRKVLIMVEIRFPNSGLSAEYGDIIFSSVTGYVLATISVGGGTVLEEKYIPDPGGIIRIMDIGDLAMVYFSNNDFSSGNDIDGEAIILSVSLLEKDAVNPVVKSVTIYPSVVDFSGSLPTATFLSIPLSRAINKTTAYGRKEWISFYGGSTVKLYAAYRGTNSDVSKTVDFSMLADAAKFYRLNVSPAVIATAIGCAETDLIYYNLYTSQESIIRFTMDERNYPSQKTFVFRNCFGAQESFTCIGDEKPERNWTRSFGTMHKRMVSISRNLDNKMTVSSGYISDEDIEVLEDLLNSDKVCLLDQYGFQDIIITDESFSFVDREDELKEVSFSYRFSQSNQFKTSYKAFAKPRIFTHQFDDSFN
jgi:hypothetical protein